MPSNDTIIALATPSGSGAIAIVRLSGPDAIRLTDLCFRSVSGKILQQQRSHTIHLGHVLDDTTVLDEVLVSVFKNPNSYTGEDVIEISSHGSPYIQQEIIQLFLKKGCRMAKAGEFTLRAFLNAKMDLSQAEAVADLIASDNQASHQIAMQQMRGGFSNEIKRLREELLNFASLIELELDFSEEDVEFADRSKLEELLKRMIKVLEHLVASFATGNVIKNGIPISIIGAPNVGKSTLLNTLLNDDKAIVSSIAGTTRDAIEDELTIQGIKFRFIDTAGIRTTTDTVESIGIQKTFEKMSQSQVILFLFDASAVNDMSYTQVKKQIQKYADQHADKTLLIVANKIDQCDPNKIRQELRVDHLHLISAKSGEGVEDLKTALLSLVNTGALRNNDTIVTNSRHYDALLKALTEIQNVKLDMKNKLSADLLSIDIRQALYHLGEITGEISSDDLLGNIFANFCIGK